MSDRTHRVHQGRGAEPGFRMPLLASSLHYIRDGDGGEQLYDSIADLSERTNLIESIEYQPALTAFRAMLLDLLEKEPGSRIVERSYLRDFRQSLADLAPQAARPGRTKVDSKTAITSLVNETEDGRRDRPR